MKLRIFTEGHTDGQMFQKPPPIKNSSLKDLSLKKSQHSFYPNIKSSFLSLVKFTGVLKRFTGVLLWFPGVG